MFSFFSTLGFWLTLVGLLISALMHWFQFPKPSGSKPNRWPLLPLAFSLLAAILSRYGSTGLSKSNLGREDSMRATISSLDSSKNVIQREFATVADSFSIVKKQLNALKPPPLPRRLRAVLNKINPEILLALKAGQQRVRTDILLAEYNELLKLSAESNASLYIQVGSPGTMGFGNRGQVFNLTLTLFPRLLSD
jgi:hypothetical protein